MSVDKFGRIIRDAKRKVVQEATASDLSVTEMNNQLIRRDGSNTVIGSINMVGNTLTNVSNPASDHDVANKVLHLYLQFYYCRTYIKNVLKNCSLYTC